MEISNVFESEVWKPVVGYEGLYEVSNYGRVKSLDRLVSYSNGTVLKFKGKVLKPQLTKDKRYYFVRLPKDGQTKNILVHRLVAQAFIPNTLNLPVVNHKNEDGFCNYVWNLEWCTAKYNLNYGTAQVRNSKNHINNPSISKPVNMFSLDGKFVKWFPSAAEALRYLGKSTYAVSNIRDAILDKRKTAYGFKWEYA